MMYNHASLCVRDRLSIPPPPPRFISLPHAVSLSHRSIAKEECRAAWRGSLHWAPWESQEIAVGLTPSRSNPRAAARVASCTTTPAAGRRHARDITGCTETAGRLRVFLSQCALRWCHSFLGYNGQEIVWSEDGGWRHECVAFKYRFLWGFKGLLEVTV